jgi:Putative Actinobacterial Holin-X, holin superfamily III
MAQLLTGLMQDARKLLRQELALALYELRRELRNTLRAGISLGIGIGIAAIGGWLLILMLVHLLQALAALPLWACYGIIGGLCAGAGAGLLVLGTRKLAHVHVVPQNTVDTMKENIQWLKGQVTASGRSRSGGPR